MSHSSKTIENEINDEPLDPRIPTELERANAATIEINNLETQFDNAQKCFQITFTNSKQRLASLAKKLGRCVERARPYYDACKRAEEIQFETQQAAQDYQNSVELYHTAQENLFDAEIRSSKIDPFTQQEYITHMTLKVTQTEQDKRRCEQIHEEKSKLYQEYEQRRVTLASSLTRTIQKARIYFQEKTRADKELQTQKLRIEDVQKAIQQAKQTYRTALTNLEQISEEIHFKRQTQLPPREPGVGAEKPIEFLEFPRLDLSDTDLSYSVSSISINRSTNCLPAFSNSLSPLTTNKSTNHSSTPTINHHHHHREQFLLSDKRSSQSKRNETPLLSPLFGIHKCPSDSNLNFKHQTIS